MQNFLRSLRLQVLITYAFFKRNRSVVFFVLLAALILSLLQYKFNFITLNKNSLSEGFIGTYQEHNIPTEVTRLLSSGLVEADKNDRIIPKLASSWEVNHDATEFKFTLKENQYWSDGSMIKSTDLNIFIPDVEISFPNDKTVVFKLKEPFSPFPSLLTRSVFKKGTLVGTGPYKILKLEKSRVFITRLVLKSMDNQLPEMTIRFYPNERTALTGFALGEVQSVWGINDQSISNSSLIGLKQQDDYSKIVVILYSTKDQVLSNRSFRQALSYSAPKQDRLTVAKSTFPPNSWAYDGEIKNYLSNSEGAKAALDRAKNAASPESLKKELILTSTPQLEDFGKKVVGNWRELGINAVLRVESGIPQNFQALLITQSIPLDPDQYFLWHSTQEKTNLTKYSSARVDKDLEDARKTTDESERKNKYQDFQKALLEDSPATFLYFPKYNINYFKKIEDKLNKVTPLQLPRSS